MGQNNSPPGPPSTVRGLLQQLTVLEKRAISAARLESERESRKVTRLGAAIVDQLQARQIQTLEFVQAALAGPSDAAQAEAAMVLLKRSSAVADALLNSLKQVLSDEPAEGPALTDFAVHQLFGKLQARLSAAQPSGTKIRTVRSSAIFRSDLRTLEKLLRALVIYATEMGSAECILIGCRRRAGKILIEVWIRSAAAEIATVGATASARSPGQEDLFHDVVAKRCGALLGHHAQCARLSDRVSVFRIWPDVAQDRPVQIAADPVPAAAGAILVVGEDAALRRSLSIMLERWTYQAVEVASALELMKAHGDRPLDPVCVVFDVPPAIGNPEAVRAGIDAIRHAFGKTIPVVVLRSAHRIDMPELSIDLEKPVVAGEVLRSIQHLVSLTRTRARKTSVDNSRTVFFIGTDSFPQTSAPLATIRHYGGTRAFASDSILGQEGCVVVDADTPGVLLVPFLKYMAEERPHLPVIVMSTDVRPNRVVSAVRAGAFDYLRKPLRLQEFQACVENALSVAGQRAGQMRRPGRKELPKLTTRERNVLDGVYSGQSSKVIAYELGISQRTVEYYRAALMKKLDATSIPDLVRLVI